MRLDFAGVRSVHYIENDPGLVWVKDSEVSIDLDSPLDSKKILTPNVVELSDGRFRIYYTGIGPGSPVKKAICYILSAVSEDGLKWRKEDGIRVNVHSPDADVRVTCPDVIPLADGRWRMYFEANSAADSPTVILSAISEDGLLWEREAGVRLESADWSYGSPRCLYVASGDDAVKIGYRLYFHQYSRSFRVGLDAENHIISGTSDNGLDFAIEKGVRIAQESLERESLCVYSPEVILLGNGSYRMYYAGWGVDIPGGILRRPRWTG